MKQLQNGYKAIEFKVSTTTTQNKRRILKLHPDSMDKAL